MSFLLGRGGGVRGKLHSSESDLRTGLRDSALVWVTGVPDYFEEVNKEGHLTPAWPCPQFLEPPTSTLD